VIAPSISLRLGSFLAHMPSRLFEEVRFCADQAGRADGVEYRPVTAALRLGVKEP
jgi:hypothetical protein